ncbi:MAG: tetratricopeptide repeat protein [Planctomycetes bacterium]|nr:tetratricopeptide repeat protein [Planctomycetota bacterium]
MSGLRGILLQNLAAGAALLAQGEKADDAFESPSHGFRVERPGRDWRLDATPKPSSGVLVVRFVHEGRPDMRASVRAAPLAEETRAETLRDRALADLEERAQRSSLRRESSRLAGREAPGLRAEVLVEGTLTRVEQRFLVEQGFAYTIEVRGARDGFGRHERDLERFRRSFRLLPASGAVREEARLAALASRCGSGIEWAEDWEAASARAKSEGRLVLVYTRFQPGFAISDDVLAGAFMDEDVRGLMEERYVPLRLRPEMEAPFRSPKAYGMSASTFGVAILLVTPAGEVVREGCLLTAEAVHDLLVEGLAFAPRSPPREEAGKDTLRRAERLLRRGEYAAAPEVIAAVPGADGHRLRADLLRRLRRGEEALSAIEAARAAGPAPDLRLDEGVILLRLGRFEGASAAIQRFLGENPGASRTPEALYWSGALALQRAGADAAREVWKTLFESHAESPWAWRAAAALQSTGISLGLRPSLLWPTAEVLDAVRTHDRGPLDVAEARRAEAEAVAFLLASQHQDGGFVCPAESGRSAEVGAGDFTRAITAICARALLAHRERPGAAEAVGRALAFLRKDREREKAAGDRVHFMDYSPWSRAYRLWLLADGVEARLVERDDPFPRELVRELEEKRKTTGGWSYYVTGNLGEGGEGRADSISFLTAAVVLSLLRAREVGLPVPSEATKPALDALERALAGGAAFDYWIRPTPARATSLPGAAGRAPLCALALHRGGRAGLDLVRDGVEAFLGHREGLAKERGKSLMHAGPDAQGTHYVSFDYAMAAAAIRSLPEPERRRPRRLLLELLLRGRCADGGFQEFPTLGRSCGTAMALLAFHDLAPLP